MDIAILILQLKAESFIFVYCYNHFLAPRAFIKIVVIPLGIYKVAFLDQFHLCLLNILSKSVLLLLYRMSFYCLYPI